MAEIETIVETFADAESRRGKIRNLLDNVGSHFARVDFVKKDGTTRRMVIQPATGPVRLAAAPPASEEGKARAATRASNNPNLYNVWDSMNMGWRSINLDTVKEVQVNRKIHKF